jgi:hypothetical protein
MSATAEHQAIQTDAAARAAELRRVACVLWADRDDPSVQSELVSVLSALAQAESAVKFAEISLKHTAAASKQATA